MRDIWPLTPLFLSDVRRYFSNVLLVHIHASSSPVNYSLSFVLQGSSADVEPTVFSIEPMKTNLVRRIVVQCSRNVSTHLCRWLYHPMHSFPRMTKNILCCLAAIDMNFELTHVIAPVFGAAVKI